MSAAHHSATALVLHRLAAEAQAAQRRAEEEAAATDQDQGRGFGANHGGRGGFAANRSGRTKGSQQERRGKADKRERKGQGMGSPQPEGAHSRGRRGSGLSAADRSPLGKAPDLEAIIARQRLGLPLAGRLREADVTRAWKLAAADHHPDRGGQLDTMQAVNTARDLLLGRGVT
jgi:hypothetical protein